MERNVIWTRWHEPGIEHCRLIQNSDKIVAESLIVALIEQKPIRLAYFIECDLSWKVREVTVELLNGNKEKIELRSDGEGNWTTFSSQPLPTLHDCLDIDLSATPFTNTLAIKRLGLNLNESADLSVAYIKVPEMQLKAVAQRYTCLGTDAQGSLYRYQALFRNFSVELPLDRDGLVTDYPNIFKRAWSD